MKIYLKLFIGLLFALILTGCIGESYDFSPPSVKLSSDSTIESAELVEANIDWHGENNNQIEKESNDILVSKKTTTNVLYYWGKS
ncbi:hypothetical protein [Robertmurraya kyonggiensis]|uniref:Uncharacterized protein n=1 Tax=Robertmurraya kyonggiensis TaxID=1037680 RepID=A0A4U1DBM9_9BACI|nr:hypothetical protein [Robertmurraya kyonggiensis]TKC20039.1 hypothetical protein FA727_11025 [Robertmurraya kyonggiensis]